MHYKTLLFVGRVTVFYYYKIPKGERRLQRLDWYLCKAYRIGRFVLAIESPSTQWKPNDDTYNPPGVPPDTPQDRPEDASD